MKFKNKIKVIKLWDKFKLKIRDLLHKQTFYDYLYKRIQNEFIYNNKSCIRFYMDANTLRDESFKVELQLYHKTCGTEYNDDVLVTSFIGNYRYIKYKFNKYRDIEVVPCIDAHGIYFEVRYKDGHY